MGKLKPNYNPFIYCETCANQYNVPCSFGDGSGEGTLCINAKVERMGGDAGIPICLNLNIKKETEI